MWWLAVLLVFLFAAAGAVALRRRAIAALEADRAVGRLRAGLPAATERTVELDWLHHQHPEVGVARILRDRIGPDGVIARTTIVDGAIDPTRPSRVAGGRFVRTIRRERFVPAPGARPWSDADAPYLVPCQRQGVSAKAGGTVVRLFQPDAVRVSLSIEGRRRRVRMRPTAGGMWQAALGTSLARLHGRRYAFVVDRRDGSRVRLADPFADLTERDGAEVSSRFADPAYEWRDAGFRAPPLADTVVYEAHLPALSRHPSAGAPPAERGTYRGARAARVVDHLARLGVAVELLPVHAYDPLLGGDWGYFATSFRAISERWAVAGEEPDAGRDLMALIDRCHQRGVPVIFDVVYNHGGELHLRALGRDVLHRRLPDGNVCEGSGCGPTVRSEHPVVRRMILETLDEMIARYHVDGFRFDLGALLDKHTMVAIDRHLPRRLHLFAEPWALGNTRWGKGDLATTFARTRWAVWNDDFREPVRTFVTGRAAGPADRDRLMVALAGHHPWTRRPQQSVNYVAVHDGLTQADLLGGDRGRQLLAVALTLFAQGVPLLAEGTELMHGKGGEHNSWDRPDVNVLDWSAAERHADLVEAVARLIELRRRLPHFKYRRPPRPGRDVVWIMPTGYPDRDNVGALGYLVRPPPGRPAPDGYDELLVLANGSTTGAHLHVPPGEWRVIADGHSLEVDLAGIAGRAVRDAEYYVHPGTVAVLARGDNRAIART